MNHLTSPPEQLYKFDLIKLFEGYLSVWQVLFKRMSAHFSNKEILRNEHGNEVNNVAKYIHSELIIYAKSNQQEALKFASEIQLKLYKKQLYAIAALIDEQILKQKEWGIQKDWLPLMMEYSLFQSRNSGDKLIDDIQTLAQRSDALIDDEKDLVSCYLKVLWLGFSGRLGAKPDEINKIKEQLMITAELNHVNLTHQKLSTKAYQHNISPNEQSRLAPISRWKRYSFLAFIFYFVISGLVWIVLTKPLDAQLKKALKSRLANSNNITNCINSSSIACKPRTKIGQNNGN